MRKYLVCAITLALASASITAVAATPAAAPASADQLATTQLPRGVTPTHYDVSITPHAKAMNFDGTVTVTVNVLKPTRSITLNALGMSFSKVSLTALSGKSAPATPKVAVDPKAQTATFTFDHAIAPGSYKLAMTYAGKIQTQANGLFAIDYPTATGEKRALYTQFENSDARRFIPSWDEPAYKATFDLRVTVPSDEMAVSNMPAASKKDLGNGMVEVTFQQSPKMSTYLLFFGLGDFDRATTMSDGTEIGVITQKGKVDQAKFALESAKAVLHEYNDYFGVRYPLPKLDNIASPGSSQFFSAMENWGAIFTFEYAMLLQPGISSNSDKQRIFSTAAHEIAHQWFGDLVTMRWWDDLWLNEGFATWMEGRTSRKLHPEWDTDHVDAVYTSRGAMGRDAYATTHPIVQHVATVEQASQAFDGITYGKGSAVIGMLEDYVGADAWRSGVRSYIKQHAHGNAVTEDLWREVDKAAQGKRFEQVAHDFTLQPGVPLIKASSACVDGSTVLDLVQGEYSIDHPDKQPLHWLVPVNVRAGDSKPVSVLVDSKAQVKLPGCAAPVVVNAGQKGYFRTLYAPAQFKILSTHFNQLPTVDQLGVMMDASALSATGMQPLSDLLDLDDRVPLDASPSLWSMVVGMLGGVDDLFDDNPARQAAYRKYALSRLQPKFAQLGWDNRKGDSTTTKGLRRGLISVLSSLGDKAVLAEARHRFDASLSGSRPLSPDLRRTILGIVAYNADAATWDKLHALAKAEKSAMVRDQYYGLLARAKDKALAQRALDMALTDEPGATNAAGMISSVSREHSDMAFDFAMAHREQVNKLVDSTSRAQFFPRLGASSKKLEMIDKIKAYADKYIAPTSRRAAETVMTAIKTRVKLRKQQQPKVDAWLKQKGY